MSYTAAAESFESLASIYNDPRVPLKWEPLFVTPAFMRTWWDIFGGENDLNLFSVTQDEMVIGVAPLMVNDGEASFVGGGDICDYFDFIIVPGKEEEFYTSALDHLKESGISRLRLESLRPDSTVITHLADIAVSRGYEISFIPNDVSSDIELPSTWDEYLLYLDKKQRHEVRRKLRRLEEAGTVRYRTVGDPAEVNGSFDTFLKMFTESRDDKADFLSEDRERFFRLLADNLSQEGIFKMGILELESVLVAMILFFDFDDKIYLYNSGFETDFISLSVGLLSKVLCIKESIESGKAIFDFLKGDEIYKARLGGREIKLTDCIITIPG